MFINPLFLGFVCRSGSKGLIIVFPVFGVEDSFCLCYRILKTDRGKAEHNAHLRSFQFFMDLSLGDLAIRIWSGLYSIDMVSTPKGKKFRFINNPFYYIGSLPGSCSLLLKKLRPPVIK